MKITICDDDRRLCKTLAAKLRRLFPEAEIRACASGEELLASEGPSDILLLDIQMPGIGGMSAARMLRRQGWRGLLIFITGEEGRVFDAFDVQAFHFLVKPFPDEKLRAVLQAASAELTRRERDTPEDGRQIQLQAGGSHICVDISQIVFAEVYDRRTILHTLREDIEYYGQLKRLEGPLGKDFFRVHRSYLVHMKYITRYNSTGVTLENGAEAPIARRKYAAFVKAYMEYSRWRTGKDIGR